MNWSIRKGVINMLLISIMITMLYSLGACEEQERNTTVPEPRFGVSDGANGFSISQGQAVEIGSVLLECDVPGWRVTAQSEVSDLDGNLWVTPAEVNYQDGPKATDLFNECNDVTLPNAEALALDSVPVTEVDDDGELVGIYFFGDNYAEVFVNGTLVGVDPVPYWPFNTSVVQVRVKRPFTLAVKMVDWEENLNIGSELMRGVPFHTGDGGFVAVVKDADGATIGITDETWRVQNYYSSPLLDPSCILQGDGVRNSDACVVPEKENVEAEGYAVRWPVPEDWADPTFDDSEWSYASLYTNEDIGGSLQRPAYSNFSGLFDNPQGDAQFIWSSNLLLDNLVLGRKRID